MWWSSSDVRAKAGTRERARRRPGLPAVAALTTRLALSLSLAGLTSGCFQPLYSQTAHPGLVEALREIEVAPIPERVGHYLSDDLITRLNGSGDTPKPKYRLTVRVATVTSTPTIQSQIQTADSATVTGTAQFVLTKIDSDTKDSVVFAGQATSSAPYDRTLNSFADLRAGRDAEIRVAKSLADEIELRVASALAKSF